VPALFIIQFGSNSVIIGYYFGVIHTNVMRCLYFSYKLPKR